jgi:hypothetical protein
VLDAPGAGDGVVAPLSAGSEGRARRAFQPIDPIAVPGVESVERQGAPPRAGFAEPPEFVEGPLPHGDGAEHEVSASPARPATLAAPSVVAVPHVGPTDSYSMRLVVSRTLYDHGAAVGASPALAALVQPATLRANPADLDDLGVPPGGDVRLRTATAETVVATRPDESLLPGVVATEFNVPFGEGTVADLIDSSTPVVELRMETP